MLKSIVNGAEHDIVSIPMKGKNLFDKSAAELGKWLNVDTGVEENTSTNYWLSAYIPVVSGQSYSFSNPSSSRRWFYNTSKAPVEKIDSSTTYTPVSNGFVRFTILKTVVDSFMLNEGSTALPYEPYGYQNGWEVRDNQNRLIWGREDELQTTTGNLLFKGYDLPIKVNSLLGSADQNGTPSPDNVVVPEFCGVRTKNICPSATAETKTNNGITAVSNGSGTYHVSGTATADADIRFNVQSFLIPKSIDGGGSGTYSMFNSATYANADVKIVFYYQGTKVDDWGLTTLNRTSTTYAIMSEKDCDAIGFTVKSGVTVDFTISPEFTNDGILPTEFEPYGYKISFDNNGENLFDIPEKSATMQFLVTLVDLGEDVHFNTFTASLLFNDVEAEYVSAALIDYLKDDGTHQYVTLGNMLEISTDESFPKNVKVSGNYYNEKTDITFRKINAYLYSSGYNKFKSGTIKFAFYDTSRKDYSPYLNKTTPIYLGEVPTIRRIKKLVLTGAEQCFVYSYNGKRGFKLPGLDTKYERAQGICTHYPVYDGTSYNDCLWLGVNDGTIYFVGIGTNMGITEPEEFQSYLAAQYQNGTPVTIWYVLSEPQTGIVNEPLAKIGDHADELTEISVHNLSAPLYGIGDYKDILNLSTGVVTRNIRKLVLTGEESWTIVSGKLCILRPSSCRQYSRVVSTHFIETQNASNPGEVYIGGSYINFNYNGVNDNVANFKSYLSNQYQNGTPVTVWYVLSTPETETITVPTGMTGEIEGYLTHISIPTPTRQSIPKWNGKEETGGTYAVTVYDLPEIPTTTGQNTLTVDTTLAPYNVTINGHIKYTYWGKIREDVRSGLAQTKFPVGTILYDNEDETTGRAFQVVGYDKHFDPSLTARGYTHSMTLCQLKLSGPWQFDAIEAFLYTTVEMQPGTYKFKIPNYDTTYGGNKTYYFTSTASVPVDSQIVLRWDYQKPPASVTAYAGPNPQTKTTAITGFNALTLTEWVEGESPEAIDLGTIKLANNDTDSTYGKLNHIHRARYGSNNYYQSGLRQLLNTDFAANNWWHPTTIFDRPYANRTTNGYLRSLNEDFINVLATPEITHIANNLFEYPSLDGRTFALNTEYKINTDKVFLLSHTEVGLSSAPNVGTILDYYSTHNTNSDRIKYRIDNGNAYYWWLRTPYPAYAHIFRHVNTTGALNGSNALNSLCVAPAHIIQ